MGTLLRVVDVAGRAREELALAGVRPRRNRLTGVAALTATELRTARLASEGLTNPEIAAELFVSRKTVEHHLSAAFRKLDISTRDAVAAALTAPT